MRREMWAFCGERAFNCRLYGRLESWLGRGWEKSIILGVTDFWGGTVGDDAHLKGALLCLPAVGLAKTTIFYTGTRK